MFGNKLLFCNCCNKMTIHNKFKEYGDISNFPVQELDSNYFYFTCSTCNNRCSYSEVISKIIKLNTIDS